MNAPWGTLDRLLQESYEHRELHPILKRLVLRAADSALKQVVPDTYFQKCHGAALAMFMILRTLRIRSVIVGGKVSWLFGGEDHCGESREMRCGFRNPNPQLPSPHAWLLTEFGSVVDLTCSYFHHVLGQDITQFRKHDVIPMIWTKSENLTRLPNVKYESTARFRKVDLEACDELARQVVGKALVSFWGTQLTNELLEPDSQCQPDLANIPLPDFESVPIIDSPDSLEQLKRTNSWVIRNSQILLASGGGPIPHWHN